MLGLCRAGALGQRQEQREVLGSWICQEDTEANVADVWLQILQVSVKAGGGQRVGAGFMQVQAQECSIYIASPSCQLLPMSSNTCVASCVVGPVT